jgi:simple sugar transport system permease protein
MSSDVKEVEVPKEPHARGSETSGGKAQAVAEIGGMALRAIGPICAALVAGGILLIVLGRNPVRFYGDIISGGIGLGAWQTSIVYMAPLLLLAAGYIVVFRANLWNLGYNGQFIIAAAVVGGYAPDAERTLGVPMGLAVMFVCAAVAGGLGALIPALLKAAYNLNEVITSLMTSFMLLSLADLLIKGPFQDPATDVAETRTLNLSGMLPNIPGTRIHVGVIFAFVVIVVMNFVMTRTSIGLRLDILGENRRTAEHAGFRLRRLIIGSFVASGALIGLAAATDILGVWGFVRAGWDPGYGNAVLPFVFLAQLNCLAVVPFVAFYSIIAVGGVVATQNAQLPIDFLLILVGLILLFMTVMELVGTRYGLGHSYLSPAVHARFRRLVRWSSAKGAETGVP